MFKELGRFTYRIQVAQCLTETDEWARLQYCSRVLSMSYADPDFFSNIWFSDERHICLNGYINRQTTHFIGFGWPDVIQKPLHIAWVMISCTVSGHGILSPYFVEDESQNPLTVNQECYREIIIAPFVRDLKHFCRSRNLPLRWQWLQQDGATAHTVGELLACPQQHFGDCLISHGTEFLFPSHSPDLMAPDAYIWGMLKESVFRSDDPPGNVPELWEKIQSFFCVLAITCVHQHVQQSKGQLWTMCEIWE